MGYGGFDPKTYSNAVNRLQQTGQTFARSAAAQADPTVDLADLLNPRKLKNKLRECCFAPGFDEAVPIIVSIDGTGSMEEVPGVLQKELGNLITLLVENGVTDHPNVMFLCHDDEYALPDDARFQMSQFEIEAPKLIEALNEMIIPGYGNGNQGEAYHLAFYAAARHTRLEPFERDGTKGFLFLIGDEEPYYEDGDFRKLGTKPRVAKAVFGDKLEAEVPMLDLVKETAKRYHIFVLRPGHTLHGKNPHITKRWQELLRAAGVNPEHVLEVAETDALVATIALAVGRILGADRDELVQVLKTKGAAGVKAAAAATQALVPAGHGNAVTVGKATATLALAGGGGRRQRRT